MCPFLVVAALLRLADDEQERFPKGAEIRICGGNNLEDACSAKEELIKILASAGMELAKWAANDDDLLQDVDAAQKTEHSFEM